MNVARNRNGNFSAKILKVEPTLEILAQMRGQILKLLLRTWSG
jgi:hypothetical protein